MQPEFCVVAVEGFDEARTLEYFQDIPFGGRSKRDRLAMHLGMAAGGFNKLNKAQIRLGQV